MTLWNKSLIAAGLLELPLLLLLVAESSKEVEHSMVVKGLIWYHVVPLAILSFGLVSLFGDGASTIGSALLWALLYWSSVFVIQVAVTAPFIRVVFGFLSSSRRSRGS
jgi:hypothetical protein